MAITSVCATLIGGHDASCEAPARKYYQQAVIMNKTDIDTVTITTPDGTTDDYKVNFTLKAGKTGYLFQGPEAGSNFFGSVAKTRSALGHAQYVHNAQVLLTGVSQGAKAIIDALDKGSFVVALQLKDGTVEIYGITNGLTTGDYTYDVQAGGGGTPVVLSSLADAPESRLPLVYESAVPGSEDADFNSLFENVV